MTNIFTIPTEWDAGERRAYHAWRPMWCETHRRSSTFSLNFGDFTNSGAPDFEVAETDTVTGSNGITWGFRNGQDPDHIIGHHSDFYAGLSVPCQDALVIELHYNSNNAALVLEPVTTQDKLKAYINMQYAYTMTLEGSATANSMRMTIQGIDGVGGGPARTHSSASWAEENITWEWRGTFADNALNHGHWFGSQNNYCGAEFNWPRYGWGRSDYMCVCCVVRADPCEHRFAQDLRVTSVETAQEFPPDFFETFWVDPVNQTDKAFQHRRVQELRVDATNWWKPQNYYGTSPGLGSIDESDGIAEQKQFGVIQPPWLIGGVSPRQLWELRIGSLGDESQLTSPGGVPTDIWLKRWSLGDTYKTDAEIAGTCPLAPL